MKLPRLVIGAASSGAGKTSLSLGLLAAFLDKGLSVRPFKIGPDYIDGQLHKLACGQTSYNLDTHLMGSGYILNSLARYGASCDIAIIEGVMGYYDGTKDNSSYDIASLTQSPAIITIDAHSSCESNAAMGLGFIKYKKKSFIQGFVLNNIASSYHYDITRTAIEKSTGLPVLGYIPKHLDLAIPSRHLGLETAIEKCKTSIQALKEAVTTSIDIKALIDIANTAPDLRDASPVKQLETKAVIAVAYDEAFSFYYHDNFDILKSLGAELVFFSPLKDKALPKNAQALYIGGGYPEVFAEELSKNTAMLKAVNNFAKNNMPIYAECGGYLYLLKTLDNMQGKAFPMCNVFSGAAHMGKKLAGIGYMDAKTIESSLVGQAGSTLHGHVFHYSWIENPPSPILSMSKVFSITSESQYEGGAYNLVFASFLHTHFARNMAFAKKFVRQATKARPLQI